MLVVVTLLLILLLPIFPTPLPPLILLLLTRHYIRQKPGRAVNFQRLSGSNCLSGLAQSYLLRLLVRLVQRGDFMAGMGLLAWLLLTLCGKRCVRAWITCLHTL